MTVNIVDMYDNNGENVVAVMQLFAQLSRRRREHKKATTNEIGQAKAPEKATNTIALCAQQKIIHFILCTKQRNVSNERISVQRESEQTL